MVTKYPTIGASTVTTKGVAPMMTPVTNTEAALLPACMNALYFSSISYIIPIAIKLSLQTSAGKNTPIRDIVE